MPQRFSGYPRRPKRKVEKSVPVDALPEIKSFVQFDPEQVKRAGGVINYDQENPTNFLLIMGHILPNHPENRCVNIYDFDSVSGLWVACPRNPVVYHGTIEGYIDQVTNEKYAGFSIVVSPNPLSYLGDNWVWNLKSADVRGFVPLHGQLPFQDKYRGIYVVRGPYGSLIERIYLRILDKSPKLINPT